jgi:acyl carrier protein
MQQEPVIVRLTTIFREVFDDDTIEVSRATTAADVEEWDSLSHIRLVVSAERAFGIRFHTGEIADLQNVGEFIDLIEAKLVNAPASRL